MVQTRDGGALLAGETTSFGAGGSDLWLVRFDHRGNVLWQKAYGGQEYETLSGVLVMPDDGFLVVGGTNSFGEGSSDAWLLKLDAQGDVEWQKTYGEFQEDEIRHVRFTTGGNIALVGHTSSFGAQGHDYWFMILDNRGEIVSQFRYGGTGEDSAKGLISLAENGYILAGETTSFTSDLEDYWVLRLDRNGMPLWQMILSGSNDDRLRAVVPDGENGFVLAGESRSFTTHLRDIWMVRMNVEGNLAWQKAYSGKEDDCARDLLMTGDRGFLMTGFSCSFGKEKDDAWLLKVNPDGSIEFSVESGAVLLDTDANIQATNATRESTQAVVSDTNIVPIDTTGTVTPTRCNIRYQAR